MEIKKPTRAALLAVKIQAKEKKLAEVQNELERLRKELRKWKKLSERNQGVVANIINTMAIVERAVQELPPEYQQRAATA